jgi:hypothetical protein
MKKRWDFSVWYSSKQATKQYRDCLRIPLFQQAAHLPSEFASDDTAGRNSAKRSPTRRVGFAAVAVQRHSCAVATRSWSTNFPTSCFCNCTFLDHLSNISDKKFNHTMHVSYYISIVIAECTDIRAKISTQFVRRQDYNNLQQFERTRCNGKIIDRVCKNCQLNTVRGISDMPKRIIQFFLIKHTEVLLAIRAKRATFSSLLTKICILHGEW